MKSLIKNILSEETNKTSEYLRIYNSKLGKAVLNDLDKHVNWDDLNYELVEISEKYVVYRNYIYFIALKYLIDQGDSPEKYMNLEDWLYRIPTKDIIIFLKDSGYYDNNIDITMFKDIKNNFFIVEEWSFFKILFDNDHVAEQVLSEDWAELFYAYDTDLEEIFDTLNDRGIKIIQEYIIENVSEIIEIGHREEFDYMTGEVGSDDEGVIDVKSNVKNIRQITDKYNLYLLVDEGDFQGKDELIRNLKSAYNMAYNSAAEDEIFNKLREEIEDYLGSHGEWDNKNNLKFPVSTKMMNIIDEYIITTNSNPFSYNYFASMLVNLFKEYYSTSEKLSTPDMNYYYPDSQKVESQFNELIGDYIYF